MLNYIKSLNETTHTYCAQVELQFRLKLTSSTVNLLKIPALTILRLGLFGVPGYDDGTEGMGGGKGETTKALPSIHPKLLTLLS